MPSVFTRNAAVGAHGQRRAHRLGGLRRADRDDDHLGRLAGFLQAQRLLDRDLVERVHRHLDVGEFDAGSVGLDADLHVVIDHPLDGHRIFIVSGNSVLNRAHGAWKSRPKPLVLALAQVKRGAARGTSAFLSVADEQTSLASGLLSAHWRPD